MGSHEPFCLVWPPAAILLISTSKVARLIGISQYAWSQMNIFLCNFYSLFPFSYLVCQDLYYNN
jgi:hypothetical protein